MTKGKTKNAPYNLQAEWKFAGVEGTWNVIDIKYLNQLQNLIYSLTGTELTLKTV